VSVHVDSAVDVVILEGTLERVRANEGPRGAKVVDRKLDRAALTRAGELYEKKYPYSGDYVNFMVVPKTAYGWRSEDIGTATRWTF
jgi:hypothetical protein